MDENKWRFINTFAPWASASATFLAVLVAIFGDAIRAALFKPRLTLSLFSPLGVLTPQDQWDGHGHKIGSMQTRYYHLELRNARKFSAARDAQVLIMRVEKTRSGFKWSTNTGFFDGCCSLSMATSGCFRAQYVEEHR
jgi:hypothetical protein